MSKIAINPFGKRFNLRNNEFLTYCGEVREFVEAAGAGAAANAGAGAAADAGA